MNILNCPFCGAEAVLIKDYACVVVCSNRWCWASMESGHEQLNNEQAAIDKWNRRFDDGEMEITIRDQIHEMVFEGSKNTEPSQEEINLNVAKHGFEPFNVEVFFDKMQGLWRVRGEIRTVEKTSRGYRKV